MSAIPAMITAAIATAILIRLLAPLAHRIGLVDRPAGHKTHSGEVPLVGGIAMFCGFLFGVLIPQIPLNELRPLFAGAALLVIIGVLDDFQELKPHTRFIAQIGAGLMMTWWGGVALADLGHLLGPAPSLLGAWSVPFTIFGVVGVINAINMLDGMDGLAGGIGLITLTLLAWLTLDAGATTEAIILATLACAVFGFLFFNLRLAGRPKALVFMGDAGSTFLGFCVAWFLVSLSQPRLDDAPVIAPVTALWLLALPLMDTVGIMLRRLMAGRSPLLADREHLHHLLPRLGLGVNVTLLLILSLATLLSLIGLWAAQAGIPERHQFAAFLGLFSIYLIAMEWLWRRLKGQAIPVQ